MYSQGTAGGMVSVGDREIQCPNFIDDYNIFFPFQRSLSAILTQNPPGIDFRPKKPNVTEDQEASDTAEGYKEYFNQSNDVPTIQQEIVRMFMLSGRTVIWTHTEASSAKFGLNDQGEPRQMETAEVFGTLESHVSIMAKCWTDSPYTILLQDIDVLMGKAEYPEKRKEIKAGSSSILESSYERIARLGIFHGTRSSAQVGDAMTHLVTRGHCFLQPSFFEADEFDEAMEGATPEEGQDGNVREFLQELYPSGMHWVLVGDQYVGSWDECPNDVLTVNFPYDGDGMFRAAMMDPMVVIQDAFNDYKNTEREIFEYGWPSTWIDADEAEYDAIVDQKADPYAIRLKMARNGQPLENSFYREPDPEMPESFFQAQQEMRGGLAQFVTGAQPSLFGAASTKTASEAALDRSQSMGILGLPWSRVQSMMASMYYHAALCASKNPDHAEEIVIPGDGTQNKTLNLAKLTKGNFGAFPDEDSSFPESTEAKRALLKELVQMAASSPVGQALFQSPDNWNVFQKLLGFPELTLVESDARDKMVWQIEQLLLGTPVPPSPQEVLMLLTAHAQATIVGQQGGGPMPPSLPPEIGQAFNPDGSVKIAMVPDPENQGHMIPQSPLADPNILTALSAIPGLLKPSMEPGPLDYYAFEGEKGKEWLSSMDCRREKANGNVLGVLNIQLYTQELLAKSAQDAMAAQAARPPSESINFKDEPPAGQEAMNKQAGINIAPAQAPKPQQTPKNQPPGKPGSPTT